MGKSSKTGKMRESVKDLWEEIKEWVSMCGHRGRKDTSEMNVRIIVGWRKLRDKEGQKNVSDLVNWVWEEER